MKKLIYNGMADEPRGMLYTSSHVTNWKGEVGYRSISSRLAFLCAFLALLSTLCTAYFYQIAHVYGTHFYISPGILFLLQLIILYFPAIALGLYSLGLEATDVGVPRRKGLAFTALVLAGLGLIILPLTIILWIPYEQKKIYQGITELTSPNDARIAWIGEHRRGKIFWWQDRKVLNLWVTDKQRRYRSHVDVVESEDASKFQNLAWSEDSSKLAYIKGDSIYIVEILDVPSLDYSDEKIAVKYTTTFPDVAFYPTAFTWYQNGQFLCLSGFLGLETQPTNVNVITTGSIKGGKLKIHVFFPAISYPDEKQFKLEEDTITFVGRDRQTYHILCNEVANDDLIAEVRYPQSGSVAQYPQEKILAIYGDDIKALKLTEDAQGIKKENETGIGGDGN